MRPLILYYSRTGKNEKFCQQLQETLKCEMEKIIDNVNRSGFWNFILAGRDALFKKLTKINPIKNRLSNYDVIIIGTPIWMGSMPPAIRTFIRHYKNNFEKVSVVSICAMGEKNNKFLDEMKSETGKKIDPYLLLSEKEFASGIHQEKLDTFIKNIQYLQKIKGDLKG